MCYVGSVLDHHFINTNNMLMIALSSCLACCLFTKLIFCAVHVQGMLAGSQSQMHPLLMANELFRSS